MAHSLDLDPRVTYHYLLNADEYPAIVPFALRLVRDRLQLATRLSADLPADVGRFRNTPSALPHVLSALSEFSAASQDPWADSQDQTVGSLQTRHYFIQYYPTALVEGCWLQGFTRVATAHTDIGARMTAAYVRHVQADVSNPGERLIAKYRDLYARIVAPVDDAAAPSFPNRREFLDLAFELPTLLLSIGQFPRTFLPELVGLHAAWHHLDSASFSRRIVCAASHDCSPLDEAVARADTDSNRSLAREACGLVLQAQRDVGGTWARVWSGIALAVTAWTNWRAQAAQTARRERNTPRDEMIELLWRKAPTAAGYHGMKQLGDRLIDDYFVPARFDPVTLLDTLAASHLITSGDPERSAFLRRVVAFGGPMYGVFSASEIETIARWIRSLGARQLPPPDLRLQNEDTADHVSPPNHRRHAVASTSSHKDVRAGDRAHSVRELYHRLVNLEFFPEILPFAERFAQSQLDQAQIALTTGPRPIPSEHYDPDALRQWVHCKHREQVDSYRPWNRQPRIARQALIDSTVELAPLILIDGSWLQGIATPSLIHRRVGSLLFRVFYEEIGAGHSAHHHANVYRDLLAAMGESVPEVHTQEFATWSRLRDASFHVPALWLSLSCFPRHFLPELLGLNLAVELAGVGGPYLEAHDALKHFGFPTLFVDLHNAADNISVGHSASAVKAITAHMDEIFATEGPHSTDYHWHRIWSGMCLTLPREGAIRRAYRRLTARLTGSAIGRRVPPIFQT